MVQRVLLAVLALIVSLWLCFVVWVNLPLHKGESLYLATVSQDYDGMKEWLDKGADVDYLFDGTTSSLSMAIEYENAKATAILLNYGAQRSKLSRHHENLLQRAAFAAKVEKEQARPENQTSGGNGSGE